MANKKRLVLIAEDFQRQPGIQFWIVQPSAFELSVLIMLDQVVVGIAGKASGLRRSVSTAGT